MRELLDLVQMLIDRTLLDPLLNQLRALDAELDQKMEDVRIAQQNVSVADRINIFTNSDTELVLKEENRLYKEIRASHGDVIVQIKTLIREAIFKDFGLALKIQMHEVSKAISGLRVESRWGISADTHKYRVHGMEELRGRLAELDQMVTVRFGFPAAPVDVDELLHAVYDEVLLKAGFIQ